MVEFELDTILHQRIINKCMSLYKDGHFPDAALESMKQVELALKEKSGTGKKLFGTNLVKTLFRSGKNIKLIIPLAEDLQEDALELFTGAFRYYRNYAAHDGSKINKIICIRIMVLASELLDLIGASPISFTDIGGVKGLIKHGIFAEESQITDLLSFLSSQACPDDCFDGLFEDLYERGYTDHQFQSVFDLGLIEYKYKTVDHNLPGEPADLDTLGWFELTPMGYMVLNKNQNV
ncbi:TIGR02391 family protein [Methanosarcina sp. DH1]|uniref:TIGR02391 family protein n=1 Tax=Methanosarcina sp. DH1 TaxID=2605695 RepID=UPI001E486DC4|nr:TIGR02391 family protein [Methanosarcina sp. DH1]